MAKRAEKNKFDRYPHINLVPFILETTGRPGPHARKFISYLMRADNPPLAIRDTLSTIQSVLYSAISKQQLTAAVTSSQVIIVIPSILGDSVRWMNSIVSALGSSSCPNAHMTGEWIHTAAADTPTAHLPVFLHLRTTNLHGPDSIMHSEHAQQRRIERRHNKHERMKRRRT